MKKLLLIVLLFSLSITIQAKDIGGITVLAGKQTSLAISTGYERLQFEIIGTGNTGYNIKIKPIQTSLVDIWLGIGEQNFTESVSDYSSNWNSSSLSSNYYEPIVHIEFVHYSGLLLRFAAYKATGTFAFIRTDNVGNVLERKVVARDFINTSAWLGYRWRF